MSVPTPPDPDMLLRYRKAAEWLVCIRSAKPSETEVQRWLTWCDDDARNLLAFETLARDWDDLKQLRDAPELLQKGEQRPEHSRELEISRHLGGLARRAKGLVSLAAGILAVLTGAYFVWNRADEPPRLVHGADQGPMILPDGSSLELSAKAAAEIDFTAADRTVALRPDGEAYIKVRHEKTRPFSVRAGPVTISALGTAFDVRRDGEHVTLTVEEGSIRMVAPGVAGSLEWQASAGYQIDYSQRERTALVASVDTRRQLQWRSGQLAYDQAPLATVVADINRYSTARLVIGDPQLARMKFSGTVFVASIEDWLGALQAIYPVSARKDAAGVVRLLPANTNY
jgi:transmembrane sensor